MTREERLRWFQNARFGMFIHWGLYSLEGRSEWMRYHERTPQGEMDALAARFNPQKADLRAWARLAREAGQKYMVLTAKHHDGFCLFDSQTTNFSSAKTASKRYFVREFVEACRAENLGVGLYFSIKDWSFPAYFAPPERDRRAWDAMVAVCHAQLRELLSHYGPIDILWYDGGDDPNFRGFDQTPARELWRSDEMNALARELQPGIILNGRNGGRGDFHTPEQEIPSTTEPNTVYEVSLTLNDTWCYAPGDTNWKSVAQLLKSLVGCAARGSNLLLNVGPDADGQIPLESQTRLREIGSWLSRNGECIYGSERLLPNWWDFFSNGRITVKDHRAFLVVEKWHGQREIVLCALENEVVGANVLNGAELRVSREGERVRLRDLPQKSPDFPLWAIELQLDGPARPQLFYPASH